MVHTKLKVWEKSMDLTVQVYRITEGFPVSEKFGLCQQMRRSSVSVPSNISEGSARSSTKELRQFLFISLASLSELETQLMISERLGYLNERDEQVFDEITQIRRIIQASIRTLNKKLNQSK